MKRILITGMSGTGKSSVIEALQARGFLAIDTDSDEWCEWTTDSDWIWREDEMETLLRQQQTHLFVSGCKSNQGKFYPQFDHVVLLSAPLEVMLQRIAIRQNNPYGKSAEEREQIIGYLEIVEPLLRSGCDLEIGTAALNIEQVADELVRLADDKE
jgi:shikimate kinase